MAGKRNKTKIVLEFDSDSALELIAYFHYFQIETKKGNDVPAEHIRDFIKFVFERNEKFFQKRLAEIPKVSQATIGRFISNPEYNFTTRSGESLSEMISSAVNFSYIYTYDDENDLDDAKKLIAETAYYQMVHYRSQLPKLKIALLTDYKLYVITAFILTQAGFPVSTSKTPTNAQLYQGIRAVLDKSEGKRKGKE